MKIQKWRRCCLRHLVPLENGVDQVAHKDGADDPLVVIGRGL